MFIISRNCKYLGIIANSFRHLKTVLSMYIEITVLHLQQELVKYYKIIIELTALIAVLPYNWFPWDSFFFNFRNLVFFL